MKRSYLLRFAAVCLISSFTQAWADSPFLTGQSASGVVGKPNFTSSTPTSPSATHTSRSGGVIVDPVTGKVFVVDDGNNRILRFASVSVALAGAAAEFVFGQPDIISGTANNGGLSETSLSLPFDIFLDHSGRLWVADFGNNRVLAYRDAAADPPTLATRSADQVIGQISFTANSFGPTRNNFSGPSSVWVEPNGSLWVADLFNNRVLRFNGASEFGSNPPATIVYGHLAFTEETSTGGQATFFRPESICVDGAGRLWVADTGRDRIMRFDNASTAGTNGLGANAVLGKSNFFSSTPGGNATRLASPRGLAIDSAGRLFVGDAGSNRVVWFDNAASLPNGAGVSGVIGQSNFIDSTGGTSASKLSRPSKVYLDPSGDLWVSDRDNNRVLRFSPIPAVDLPRPSLKAKGKTKLTTGKAKIILKGSGADATRVEFQVGKGGFKSAQGSAASWKIPLRLTDKQTVVKVRATGPGGLSEILPFKIIRK